MAFASTRSPREEFDSFFPAHRPLAASAASYAFGAAGSGASSSFRDRRGSVDMTDDIRGASSLLRERRGSVDRPDTMERTARNVSRAFIGCMIMQVAGYCLMGAGAVLGIASIVLLVLGNPLAFIVGMAAIAAIVSGIALTITGFAVAANSMVNAATASA